MSRSKKKLDNKTLPLPFGGNNSKNEFADVLNQTAKKSKLSRERIAEKITKLTGHRLTLNMINNYLDSGEEKGKYNFPAHLVPAFCSVCENAEPLFFLNRQCGIEGVDTDTLRLAQLGRICLAKEEQTQEEQALKWLIKKGGT